MEVPCEVDVGGTRRERVLRLRLCGGGPSRGGCIAVEIYRIELNQAAFVAKMKGGGEHAAMEFDLCTGISTGHLVGETLDGNDVVGGNTSFQVEDESLLIEAPMPEAFERALRSSA